MMKEDYYLRQGGWVLSFCLECFPKTTMPIFMELGRSCAFHCNDSTVEVNEWHQVTCVQEHSSSDHSVTKIH